MTFDHAKYITQGIVPKSKYLFIFILLIAQFGFTSEHLNVPKISAPISFELSDQPLIVGTFFVMQFKMCNKCNTLKLIDQFNKDKNRSSGVYPNCKECSKIAKRISYNNHLEKNREKKREYAKTHKKEQQERHRRWYLKNRIKKLSQNKEWTLKNPDRYKEIIRNWEKNNPEKVQRKHKKWRASPKGLVCVRESARKRKLKVKNAKGTHSPDEWENLKKLCNYMCSSCWRVEPEIKLTRDHIIPLSKGGSDDIENIQPLCQSCNSKKKVKVIKYGVIRS